MCIRKKANNIMLKSIGSICGVFLSVIWRQFKWMFRENIHQELLKIFGEKASEQASKKATTVEVLAPNTLNVYPIGEQFY